MGSGTLVVPERNDYTFSIEGVGNATLQIDGVMVANGELPLVAQRPVPLGKGGHAIFCSYRSRRDGEARIRLFWSGPQFRSEPVPASQFRFTPGDPAEVTW